jgi:hypothetical protein
MTTEEAKAWLVENKIFWEHSPYSEEIYWQHTDYEPILDGETNTWVPNPYDPRRGFSTDFQEAVEEAKEAVKEYNEKW